MSSQDQQLKDKIKKLNSFNAEINSTIAAREKDS